ncbi:hypothetical protein TSOC_014644, partial [Tetrabaena socialis]
GLFYFENVMELAAAQRGAGPASSSAASSSSASSTSSSASPPPGVVCKPNPLAYQLVAQHLGLPMSAVMFFDDSLRNVAAAHALGALTVLVGAEEGGPGGAAPGPAGADLRIPTMHRLPHYMPQLLDQPGMVHDHHHHHSHQEQGQGHATGHLRVPVVVAEAVEAGLGLPGGSGGVALPVPA